MEHDCILAEANRNSKIGPPKIFNHNAGKKGCWDQAKMQGSPARHHASICAAARDPVRASWKSAAINPDLLCLRWLAARCPVAAQLARNNRSLAQGQVDVQHGKIPSDRSGMGLVSRVSPVQTALRNCTRDEGRPFEVGNQVLISSHRKLLLSKAMVVNVAEKSKQDFGRYD